MKKLILPKFIAKSHVSAYTRKDGTFVAEHEDKRQKHARSEHGALPSDESTWYDWAKEQEREGRVTRLTDAILSGESSDYIRRTAKELSEAYTRPVSSTSTQPAQADKKGNENGSRENNIQAKLEPAPSRVSAYSKFGIQTPEVYAKLGKKGMEKLAMATDHMGYDLTPGEARDAVAETVAYLKKAGISDIDLYHVTDVSDFGKDGIRGSEVSNTGREDGNTRAKSVYAFLDPDDIPKAFDGVMGATSNTPYVAHVKIPVDDIYRLVWDSNFNVTYGVYSGVRYKGDVESDSIVSVNRLPAEAINLSSPSKESKTITKSLVLVRADKVKA